MSHHDVWLPTVIPGVPEIALLRHVEFCDLLVYSTRLQLRLIFSLKSTSKINQYLLRYWLIVQTHAQVEKYYFG